MLRRVLAFTLCVACSGLSPSAAPRKGEVGYKRYRAREAVRHVLRSLRDEKPAPLPSVAGDLDGLGSAVVEPVDGHSLPLGPVGAAPWGAGMPSRIDASCRAICDASEEESLLGLKRALAPWVPSESSADYREAVHGDVRLLRFLRKFGTAERAAEAYRDMLEWRAVQGVDSSLRVEAGCSNTEFEHHEALYRLMPVDVSIQWPSGGGGIVPDGSAPEGLMHMSLGGWDSHGLVDAVRAGQLTEDDFVGYWIQVNEMISLSLDGVSREHRALAGFHIVCDFERTSWRQFSRPFLDLMKLWASISDYYPSTSREILFANTPFFFRQLWQFIQPVLNDDTRSKIRLVPKGQPVA